MKIAVVCANGKAGSLIVKEAAARGLDVTAIVRGENRSVAKSALIRDLFELTREDLKPFDVIVDAFGAWTADAVSGIPAAVRHLCGLIEGTDKRLIVVGGAGSLYVNPEHTACVADGPDFPDAFKPLAAAHDEALSFLRTQNSVKWTYVSPAADFRADGERTGRYIPGGEELVLNDRGESVLSYADYAVALVDEITSGRHIGARISVAGV